jgi:hypothetical protein
MSPSGVANWLRNERDIDAFLPKSRAEVLLPVPQSLNLFDANRRTRWNHARKYRPPSHNDTGSGIPRQCHPNSIDFNRSQKILCSSLRALRELRGKTTTRKALAETWQMILGISSGAEADIAEGYWFYERQSIGSGHVLRWPFHSPLRVHFCTDWPHAVTRSR